MKSDVVFALENAGWPALLLDGAGNILRANQTAVKTFGSVLEGGSPLLSSIWAPENNPPAAQFLAQWERSPSPKLALKLRVKGGGIEAFQVSICGFTHDGQKFFLFQLSPASETAAVNSPSEESALQKRKLDWALQMARTVSLDFNNALTSILGHTSHLLNQSEPGHPWRQSLIEVEKSAARAAEIANDLGTFSHQVKEPRPQSGGSVNTVVQRAIQVFKTLTHPRIEWKFQPGRKLYSARFDEAKIQQAFVKIIENAVQAISDDGRITIQTRNVELLEPAQDRDLRLEPGIYVCTEITDTGKGIPPEDLPRIFEPFFTTKSGAKHRGLGLALVYGIVTNHGGGIAVSSQINKGTSVRVYLPAEKKTVLEDDFESTDLKGTQTILMVDDEELLLTLGRTVLSAYGYRVLTAASGNQALDIIKKGEPPIDLVITDLMMPGMSGRELMERLYELSPRTRVLCTSGYVRPNSTEEASYLQKPFTSQALLTRVKQLLSAE